MKLAQRKFDAITGADDLEDLYSFKDFPVFMGSVPVDSAGDITSDMNWCISRSSGAIQLRSLLPLDVLYQSQTTTAAIGSQWMSHHKLFAKYIYDHNPMSVLEIGGAHGILATEYCKDYKKIAWSIIEPNPSPIDGCPANFIKGYFDGEFTTNSLVDTVIHSHVFEHIYDPLEFVRNLDKFINVGQKMIFSVPNLKIWLERKYTNCINFEHTIFLTEPYIEYLLEKNGFIVVDKQNIMEGHSIFYSTIKSNKKNMNIKLSEDLYLINKKIFNEFIEYYKSLVQMINEEISKSVEPVYIFGAHVFTQYLLNFGLDTDKIMFVLDNDKNKQNKRLYGTNLICKSPDILKGNKKSIVILKAGIYNEEIKNDIVNNINKNTIFI